MDAERERSPGRRGGGFSGWMRRRTTARHRRKGYRFQGMDVLILKTVGRSSGQLRETPVAWFPDGDDSWLVVASAAGRERPPAWYHNLRARPDDVTIELPTCEVRVRGTELRGPEREARWQRIVEAQPRYGKYQRRTGRQIAVIRLVACDPSSSRPVGSEQPAG